MKTCDSLNCDSLAFTKVDGFDFCYKCFEEYKSLNDGWEE